MATMPIWRTYRSTERPAQVTEDAHPADYGGGRMRALVLARPGTLELRDVPEPVAGPGEAMLEVRACGLCGSDLSMISMGIPEGAVLGHEVVADVLDAPAGCGLAPGDRVVVRPNAWCGSCRWCTHGAHQLCPDAIPRGLGIGRQGGFAERMAVPVDLCYRILGPEILDAVFADPLAVALHAVARAAAPRASFAVLGLGPTGLAVLGAALLAGMGPGVGVDAHEVKRQRALALGAPAVTVPGDAAAVHAALGGLPDVVFECAGRPQAIGDALALAGTGGQVVLVGMSLHPATIHPGVPMAKELDIRASYCYGASDWDRSLDVLRGGQLRMGALVDGAVSLPDVPPALELLAQGQVTKIVALAGG